MRNSLAISALCIRSADPAPVHVVVAIFFTYIHDAVIRTLLSAAGRCHNSRHATLSKHVSIRQHRTGRLRHVAHCGGCVTFGTFIGYSMGMLCGQYFQAD